MSNSQHLGNRATNIDQVNHYDRNLMQGNRSLDWAEEAREAARLNQVRAAMKIAMSLPDDRNAALYILEMARQFAMQTTTKWPEKD